MIRLVSIFNVWADTLDLLPKTIENHLKFSDGVIVIWSISSNHEIRDERMLEFVATHKYDRVLFHQLEPIKGNVLMNETRKRNRGLDVAKAEGYTHYLIADGDECYIPQEIENDKKLFSDTELVGLVYRLRVYIKTPQLWCNDHTLVAGIHKLKKESYVGVFKEYPFAYDHMNVAQIDPSRRPNELTGIKMSDTVMHHFSYVRNDIDVKIRNSSAKLGRHSDRIKRDLARARPGYVSELYNDVMKESPNYFDL